jgi:hypothetical protein
VLLICAAAALASKKSATKTVAADSTASARVLCPKGQRPNGAGFKTQVGIPVGSGPIVLPSSMRITGHGARTTATNSAAPGGPDGSLKVFAYCSAAGQKLDVRTKTVPLPGGKTRSATATCPRHTTVLGGGFQIPISPPNLTMRAAARRVNAPAFDLLSGLSRPTSRTWKVTAVSTPGSGPGHVTSIAYCGAGPAAVPASETRTVPASGRTNVITECPAGTQVLFGGEITQFGNDLGGPGITAAGLFRAGGAKIELNAVNDDAAGNATAIAYCR